MSAEGDQIREVFSSLRQQAEHFDWELTLKKIGAAEVALLSLEERLEIEILAHLTGCVPNEQRHLDLLESAWGLIANAGGGGNWENERVEWQVAAVQWRERWHDELRSTERV